MAAVGHFHLTSAGRIHQAGLRGAKVNYVVVRSTVPGLWSGTTLEFARITGEKREISSDEMHSIVVVLRMPQICLLATSPAYVHSCPPLDSMT